MKVSGVGFVQFNKVCGLQQKMINESKHYGQHFKVTIFNINYTKALTITFCSDVTFLILVIRNLAANNFKPLSPLPLSLRFHGKGAAYLPCGFFKGFFVPFRPVFRRGNKVSQMVDLNFILGVITFHCLQQEKKTK